jgi:hypothetical protein
VLARVDTFQHRLREFAHPYTSLHFDLVLPYPACHVFLGLPPPCLVAEIMKRPMPPSQLPQLLITFVSKYTALIGSALLMATQGSTQLRLVLSGVSASLVMGYLSWGQVVQLEDVPTVIGDIILNNRTVVYLYDRIPGLHYSHVFQPLRKHLKKVPCASPPVGTL